MRKEIEGGASPSLRYWDYNPMNILIVDDETIQLESIKRGLRNKGHRVAGAADGCRALELIQNPNDFDLVLTDFAMPGMNGIELLIRIREERHGLPVLIMTAYGDDDLKRTASLHRCSGFIEKPFTSEELALLVEKAADDRVV